jgi:acetyltransferase
VVITAGFGESSEAHGKELQQALLEAAKPYLLRIIGPNCLGILVPGIGLNASFSHLAPAPGLLAFVAQSGAIVTSVVDWAHKRNIGFSHLVSLGDMSDVDFGDMLDYLANDRGTKATLLYIEAVSNARKFLSAARAAARMKPTIVVKAGRHAEGARAAASHTGALAGSDAVYDAAIRRAGMLRVYSLEQLFEAVEILAMAAPPKDPRLAILTNGGGIGVLATDALIEEGGQLAELAPETLNRLNQVLPQTWSHGNPVDIIGDAPGSRYAAALGPLLEDKGIDAILALNCPTAVASSTEAAQAVIETLGDRRESTLLASWVGDGAAEPARRLFAEHRIPSYATPDQAVRAFMYMVYYRRNQDLLLETPPSLPEAFSTDPERARALIERTLAEGRIWLTEPEAKEVLFAYGIPVVPTRTAQTPKQAAGIAAELGGMVALKVLSPDITHKSEFGGVALGLAGPAAVENAAQAMLQRVREARPNARLEGFSVQPMVYRPGAYELIVGITEDAQFGPVILFGQGGTAVEVVNDKALGLPPLNMHLARELMSRTRIYRLLQGYRGMAAANLEAIALTLMPVAQIAIDFAEVTELDVNPLLADAYGVVALDARIKVARAKGAPTERLAIRPYPKELEEEVILGDGRHLLLRPILPEDEPGLQASFFAKLTLEERRLRFLAPIKTLTHVMAARFTQIDYDREMVLVLTERGIPGKTGIHAVVQISANPNNECAEFAIIVRGDMTRRGIGTRLMGRILDYAKSRGLQEIFGEVLQENTVMRRLCQRLGFVEACVPEDRNIVRVPLTL